MSGALPSDRATRASTKPASGLGHPAGIPSADGFFPFCLRAIETPHYTSSPTGFREVFLANKPAGLSWYAYDVAVLSETEVEFTAFDIRDNFHGGIGKEVAWFAAFVEAETTRPAIERRIRQWAEDRRADELEAREEAVISRYEHELAQAIKARRAETAQTGSVHESAVPKGCAQ